MLNMRLIDEAVRLAENYYEANLLRCNSNNIRTEAINWYSNTEIVDAEMLAAVVLTYACIPEIIAEITWDRLLQLKEFYFPTVPFEYVEFGIGEIEEAMNDAFWR